MNLEITIAMGTRNSVSFRKLLWGFLLPVRISERETDRQTEGRKEKEDEGVGRKRREREAMMTEELIILNKNVFVQNKR